MTNLSPKVALITGSTSGIGEGIARAFAKAGCDIVLNGFGDRAQIDALMMSIHQECGVRVAYHPANLLNADEISELIDHAHASIGEIDILVNNAGIQHVSPIEDFPVDKWNAIIGLNLTAAFHTTRLLIAGMKSRGFGRIINIASAHALVASPYKSAYVAAKHGLLGMTKSVALEAASFGVTANAVCPGYVRTPLVDKQIPDTMKARNMTEEQVIRDVLLAAQPTKKFVTVEQIAELCILLASDAGASINGTALSIDGGWTAQ